MRAIIRISFALIGLVLAQNGIACEAPADISIPDGKKASEADMTEAGKQYHRFMLDMQIYQVCLEDAANQERLESDGRSKGAIKSQENQFANVHNAASAAMRKTTKDFEKTVTDYKSR